LDQRHAEGVARAGDIARDLGEDAVVFRLGPIEFSAEVRIVGREGRFDFVAFDVSLGRGIILLASIVVEEVFERGLATARVAQRDEFLARDFGHRLLEEFVAVHLLGLGNDILDFAGGFRAAAHDRNENGSGSE
jgi:hypothetical protein